MKKLVLSVAFVCVAQFASAQDTFKDEIIQLIKVSGSAGQMTAALDQILPMIPEDKQVEFKKDFEASLPSLYEKIIPIFEKHYTKEDIKEMLKFYNSPIGKKISKNSESIATESMEVGQEWAMGLQGLMMKYMQ